MDEKALAAVDDEWRSARQILDLVGEDALSTVRSALGRLVNIEAIERRYDVHRSKITALYRRREVVCTTLQEI